ncbi:MAG TPA: hypothetical protein VHH54_02300 [Actinomycetota bacterium]|nr:hypothetical protein [Actinomycetota bacterium]
MTKRKRKSKRQAGSRRTESRPARAVEEAEEPRRAPGRSVRTEDGGGPRSAGTSTRQRAGAERAQPAVVYPPLGVSLARGMRAVGTSPALLATAFLGELALWLAYSAYGSELASSSLGLIHLESLPPFQSLVDLRLLGAGRPASASTLIGLGLGVMAVRAFLVTVWITMMLRSLRAGAAEPVAVASSGRQGIRKYPIILGIQVILLMVIFAAGTVAPAFLGGQFGQLGVIVVLLAGMYFFVFAPVVAVADGVGLREEFRLSIRAARVPGPRHMVLTFSYVAFALFLLSTAPVSPDLNATPSILVWVYALFVAFLHVSVLAALTFRWLFVREHVLQEASAAASPARSW